MTNGRGKTVFLFLAIVVAQIAVFVFFGRLKEGFFVDELRAFHLSNSYYLPLIDGTDGHYFRTLLDSRFFAERLFVSDGHAFSYGSVLYNLERDGHAPLYFLFLHTFFSIAGGDLKWTGIALNAVCFVLTQVFVYKTVLLLSKERRTALLACLFYGFSLGAVATVLLIRMTALLTLFATVAVYLNVKVIKRVFCDSDFGLVSDFPAVAGLFVTYLLGLLTQYYFVVYAFFLSLFAGLVVLSVLGIRQACLYAAATVLPVLAGMVVFPASFTHVFFDYRGAEALENLTGKAFLPELGVFLGFLSEQSYIAVSAAVIVCLSLCLFFARRRELREAGLFIGKKGGFAEADGAFLATALTVLSVSALCAFLLVVQIVPYRFDRYLFFLYPAVFIVSVTLIGLLVFHVFGDRWIVPAVLALTLACSLAFLESERVAWLYPGEQEMLASVMGNGKVTGALAVVFRKHEWKLVEGLRFLTRADKSFVTTPDNLSFPKELSRKDMVLLIDDSVTNYQRIVEDVRLAGGYRSTREFKRDQQFPLMRTYILER